MPAILFGSISTLADTSEIQRQAFNEAFAQHGLDWHWDREQYVDLLKGSGGEQRIAEQAAEREADVDPAAVHATKTERFHALIAETDLKPRAGVVDTIREARAAGFDVAFVTTTSSDNVTALLAALEADVPGTAFDLVLDRSDVDHAKPADDVYRRALERLGQDAGACVAIEDNLGGVQAATSAGVACAAFPNQNTAGHDFSAAGRVVDHLDLDELRTLIAA